MTVSATKPQRKPTNIKLDVALLTEAKALGINICRTAEQGLRQAVAERRAELWKEENQAAIDASNTYVEQHGVPLASHRKF